MALAPQRYGVYVPDPVRVVIGEDDVLMRDAEPGVGRMHGISDLAFGQQEAIELERIGAFRLQQRQIQLIPQ